MASSVRGFMRFVLLAINSIAVILLGLCGLIPFVHAPSGWWLNLAGLLFPFAFFVVFFFLVFWLVVKPVYSLASLLVLLLCWRQVTVVFRLSTDQFVYTRNHTVLRVLSWNVKVFEGLRPAAGRSTRDSIISFLKSTDADVVCLQEFSQYDSTGIRRNHLQAMQQAGYPYYTFSTDYQKRSVDYRSGVAIFSKTPLLHTSRVAFDATPESILYADITRGSDTFRIFTTHLQSFKFSKADYRNIEWIKRRGDITNPGNLSILSKMKTAIQMRRLQAQQIRSLLDSCPYLEMVCGDFNDIPNSYTYWHIRGDRQDAFVERGNGVGRTFVSLAPMLRIDYILYDKRLQLQQFTVSAQPYSDHLPVIADILLTKTAP